MGGAYSNEENRFSREDHDFYYALAYDAIQHAFQHSSVAVPHDLCEVSYIPFYDEKEDFGDIDIVIKLKANNNTPHNFHQVISNDCKKYIEARGHDVRVYDGNKSTVVMVVDEHQIDMNYLPGENADIFKHFFAYNGLNVLLNKTLKLSHCDFSITKGFRIKLNHFTDYKFDNVVNYEFPKATIRFDLILDILLLDKEKFYSGFTNYPDMFAWIAESPYFSTKALESTNLNAKKRREYKNNMIVREANEYFANTDFSQSKILSFADVCQFFDDYYKCCEGTHDVKILAYAKEVYVEQIYVKEHRRAKSFMLSNIREQFVPDMTDKAFNYQYIRPLYMNGILDTSSTLSDLSKQLIMSLIK